MQSTHGRVSETGLPIILENPILSITILLHCDVAARRFRVSVVAVEYSHHDH